MAEDQKKSGAIIAGALVLALPLALVFSVVLLGGSANAECNPTGGGSVTVDPGSVPETTIDGYGHGQLVNAAHIIEAGKALGLEVRDQTIGVMTAMGESTLNVIDYGDGAGPDSRGLFQQRDNGAWGTYEDRMDPYISATNFFKAMIRSVPERESLEPTIVAHRTQINADPYHYEKYWDTAVKIVEAVTGSDTGLIEGTGGQVCNGETTVPGEVNKAGWAQPGTGPVNNSYGPRDVIYTSAGPTLPFHYGIDLGAGGCDGAIWAAQAGTVSNIIQDSGGGWRVELDHGGGVKTWYVHMYADGILVKVGDKPKAGQQIAKVGSSGFSTGCH
ncbi:MAG: M23 family metallopeptidase, partial [Specibacter sp.]